MVFGAGSLLADDEKGGRRKDDEGRDDISVHEKNKAGVGRAPTAGGTAALSAIRNHGGPVMVTPVAYLIWYGNWNQTNASDTPAGQELVRTFLRGLGNSPYFNINKSYASSGNVILSSLEYTDPGSLGTTLSDSNVRTIVSNAINSGRLGAADQTGVYFVLTSSNVNKSGFCSQYCGWHTYATINRVAVKYSFVGNAQRCLSACAAQSVSPNGNPGVDGMISVIAHELEETASDPLLNAWYDASGNENADKCAWTFGSAQTRLPNGASYNMTVGGKNFLVQRNLSAEDNKCYVEYHGRQ
ncbi:MAG: hypothetical protein U0Q16_05165 [Bryobacteraceae bacterium]